MTELTDELKERIADHLGYQDVNDLRSAYRWKLGENLLDGDRWTTTTLDTLESWLDQLDSINKKLTEARSDSMAVEVGELVLSYPKHVRHLLFEAQRTQCNIAQRLNVGISGYLWGQPKKAYFIS